MICDHRHTNIVTDYANLGFNSSRRPRPWLLEAFRGTAIVGWQGKIERQLDDFAAEAVEARNNVYADKIRAYLALWRANPLNGSINVETIETLLAASEVPAVDDWRFSDYFSNLRDQLRKLKASVEELPMGEVVPPDGRAPSSSPPSSFGPSETPPPGTPPGPETEPGNETDTAAAALTGEAPENRNRKREIPGT